MINIKFNKLKLEGFQSLDKATLDFNNLGICFINGINNYDNKTSSNGSGKTSLMSSIFWCLFGKTPTGIGNDVVNKFSKTGCFVELYFEVDNIQYIIRRSQSHTKYKTNLAIFKNSEDISARNKRDSEKIIKDILKIDNDLFSQMIFLSQGFANRFAIYTPSARRDLLESLYNIDEKLNNFIYKLKDKESNIKNVLIEYDKQFVEYNTSIKMLRDYNECIMHTNKKLYDDINNLKNIKCNVTEEDINNLKSHIQDINNQIDVLNKKINKQYQCIVEITNDINHYKAKIRNNKSEIEKFSNNKTCPVCGTILEDYEHNQHIQQHLVELQQEINDLFDNIKEKDEIYQKNNETFNKMESKLDDLKNKLNLCIQKFNEKNDLYKKELQKSAKINSIKDKIKSNKESIIDNEIKIKEYNKLISDLNDKKQIKDNELNIIQHCIRLANNQFKSYLLKNIIDLLNSKLEQLSSLLFENEIIKINGETKLNILLNDKVYEQLSGGEQRKIDIAIIIAQRYLAQQMNSISSNVLILDEVFDGCDDTSFMIILDLLMNEMQDVETMFIISHRDIKEIPFDHIITVTKEKNQISSVDII